jgi:HlyD family secretion protein
MLRALLIRAATGTLVVAGAAVTYSSLSKEGVGMTSSLDDLRYVSVERGDVLQNVAAAGTLEAVDTVDISSQLSGQIAKLMADYNSIVRSDEPLAALDSSTYQVLVEEAKAALEVAQAQLEESKAEIEAAQTRYNEAIRDSQVKSTLARSGGTSQRDAERSSAAAQTLAAELSSAKARERIRSASVVAARAALDRADIDLKRTIIRSPIDGVIIQRSVEVGQTVAASLQAPTLFTIARDLSDMRVNTSISEADIGVVRIGQAATFGVDSYPGRTFEGQVLEIRKAPRMVQDVVTYTVMISAPNRDGLLFPGMTADVRIVVQNRPNVLVVPNVALSFLPPDTKNVQKLGPGQGVVWRLSSSGTLIETNVALGATGESLSEITAPGVKVGDKVAIGFRSQPRAEANVRQ